MHEKSALFRDTSFGLLYFVQGAAFAYFSNFQKPYLDRFDVDADVIGILTTLLLLPFVLKIFVGMLSDRVNLFGMGYRKPYIIGGLLLAAAGLVVAGFMDPATQFTLYAAAVFVASFAVTLFDTATDGLAVDTTPFEQQGRVQSIMTAGRAAGFILLSFVFGQIAGRIGFRAIFLIIAAAMLIPLIWVAQMREPPHRATTFDWSAFKAMGQPRFVWFAVFLLVQSFIQYGIDGLPTFYMAAVFNAPETLIGLYGTLRGVGAVGGALLVVLLMPRLGRQRMVTLSIGLIALFGAAFAFATTTNMILMLALIWGMAWGLQGTVIVALAMDLCDPRIAASMFAIMMGIVNLGTAVGDGIGTSLTDNIGFSTVFLVFAALTIVEFLLARRFFSIATLQGEPVG